MKESRFWAANAERVLTLAQAYRDRGQKPDWVAIAATLSTPTERVSPEAARHKEAALRSTGHVEAVLSAPADQHATDPTELWQRAERVTARDVKKTQLERFLDAKIGDDRPIGISVVSDQHITTRGPAQLTAMREDADLIRATDGLYAILGGDGVDNHIKHRAAVVAAGSKVSEQWQLYDHYLGMFGPGKILAMVSGNHDDWTRDEAGVDMVAMLAKAKRLRYHPDEVIVRLSLGGQPYRIAVRHQYRYNSSFNLTHTVKQWLRMGQDDWDIGVICHHHEAAVEPFSHHGVKRWAARPGSYQVGSGYSRRIGFNHTRPTCPTFILSPGERRIQGYDDVWEAAAYLAYLRAGWPQTRIVRPSAA